MKNTAIFLAQQWMDTENLFYRIIAIEDPKAAIAYLIKNYPVIQGTKIQTKIQQLASLKGDTTAISNEIDAVLCDKENACASIPRTHDAC